MWAFEHRGSPDPVTFPLPPTHFPGFLKPGLLPLRPAATLPAVGHRLGALPRTHIPPPRAPLRFGPLNGVPLHTTRPRDRPSQGPAGEGKAAEGGGRGTAASPQALGRLERRAARGLPGILGVAAGRPHPPWAEVGDIPEFISDLLALQHLLELPLDSLHRDVGHVSARS